MENLKTDRTPAPVGAAQDVRLASRDRITTRRQLGRAPTLPHPNSDTHVMTTEVDGSMMGRASCVSAVLGRTTNSTLGSSTSDARIRLFPTGRLLPIARIEAGTAQAEATCQMRLLGGTVAKWGHRWCAEGEAGLRDRSGRPHRSPRRTAGKVEERICRLRRSTKRGSGVLACAHRGALLDGLAGARP